ncbi:MAG: type II secretion system F family protein [Acidiferrobacter sp.]
MQKVYRYTAKNRLGHIVEGALFAPDQAFAMQSIRRLDATLIDLRLSWADTINTFSRKHFDMRELAQVYSTMGRRVENGTEIPTALRETAEFVLDVRLKIALGMAEAQTAAGQPMGNAFATAGFPPRDCAMIMAMQQAGNTGSVLIALGQDYRRLATLQNKMRALIYEPAFFFSLAYIMIWAATVFAIPRIQNFFAQLPGARLPGWVSTLYGAAGDFDAHLTVGTILYVAGAIGLIWFIRSPMFGALLDKIPVFRALSERSDHAALWSSFATMYDAAIAHHDIARMLSSAANREDNKTAFVRLHRILQSGQVALAQAVQRVGFPAYIASAVARALSAGDATSVIAELRILSENLGEDVDVLATRVTKTIDITLKLVMGLVLLAVALVTVIPMVLSTLSQV